MRDKQIIEKEKKRIDEEMRYQQKKLEVEVKKKEEESEKAKKNKEEKKAKKKSGRQMENLPLNVTELPSNIVHLTNPGDLQFLVIPDGACAANCGAAHIFQDPKYGPRFRKVMNTHIADRWDYYREKISFPYTRQVGVKGNYIRFETGEEVKFLSFLRSNEAEFLWCDSEDLHVMSNLYQMSIKVIKIKSDKDDEPSVSWIGPDPELDAFKFLPEGKVPEMVLINYDQQHYNLIISQDSSLAKVGTLSEHLEESIDEEVLEEDEEEMGMEVDDQVTIAEKFASLEKEYRKSQNVIKMLNKKVSFLEKKLMSNNSKDDSVTEIDDLDVLDETEILINKSNGYRRDGPHAQPKPSNPGTLVFQCKECKVMLETKGLLSAHEKNHSEMKH